METTGGCESVGGEGVSRWRSLEEVRVCEELETIGERESGEVGCEQMKTSREGEGV